MAWKHVEVVNGVLPLDALLSEIDCDTFDSAYNEPKWNAYGTGFRTNQASQHESNNNWV